MSQSTPDNEEDLTLLQKDPNALLLRYQKTLGIIVEIYVGSGMFGAGDREDVLQTLNEELLRRMPTIRAQYNGSALLRTYVSAIVRNLCLDLAREKARRPREIPLDEGSPSPEDEAADRYDLDHARGVFRAVLRQFDYKLELPRLLFCLKLRYRLPLRREDILSWYPQCRRGDVSRLLKEFGGDYESRQDKQIFKEITPVLNRADRKTNSPDAIRRWIRKRMKDIIQLLNGSPPTRSFDEETLKILVEDYFSSISPPRRST
jgi:DNA-directed RNA polymerase specialized sigma24 family protein